VKRLEIPLAFSAEIDGVKRSTARIDAATSDFFFLKAPASPWSSVVLNKPFAAIEENAGSATNGLNSMQSNKKASAEFPVSFLTVSSEEY
jgi:hypothetical protein